MEISSRGIAAPRLVESAERARVSVWQRMQVLGRDGDAAVPEPVSHIRQARAVRQQPGCMTVAQVMRSKRDASVNSALGLALRPAG